MKIDAITNNPQGLINAIDFAFKKDELKTWEKKLNGKGESLYSHTGQWAESAMPKPYIYKDKVTFEMKWWSKDDEPDKETKGYILGRFTEILMVHFRDNFDHLIID